MDLKVKGEQKELDLKEKIKGRLKGRLKEKLEKFKKD